MEKIEHSQLDVRGLSLHVAHTGNDEQGVVVFLHGFPEIWYSWRHQMISVARAGYRAIAPDFRGYGLSQVPAGFENGVDWSELVLDLLETLVILAIPKAFIVAKDFGCKIAFLLALQYPEKVSGLITIGVPFSPHKFDINTFPEGFYVRRWQEPGRAESDFARFDTKMVVRNIYILFSGCELPVAKEDQEIMDLVGPETPLPPWLTEEDLMVYATLYEKSGFGFPLQMPYKASYTRYETPSTKIEVPSLLIMGGKDYFLKFPKVMEYIESKGLKDCVPDLEVSFIKEGSHFVQEQLPRLVHRLLAPATVAPAVEIHEEPEEGAVEGGVEEPAAEARAASGGGPVKPQEAEGEREAEDELSNLEIGDRPLPPGRPPPAEAAGEVVGVHDDVYGGVGDEGDGEEGLAGGEPDVAHDRDDGVVVDVEEGEAARVREEDEEGVEELVQLREVEEVGVEEDRPGRGRRGREAEEGGAREAEGGEGAADGHDEGEEEEEEVVEGGEEAERRRRRGTEAEEEGEGEVEEKGSEEGGGGREEGATGVPPEAGDLRVVDQVVPEDAGGGKAHRGGGARRLGKPRE